MAEKILSYFEHRAEVELEMAQRATHPAALRAHCVLADLYLDRVYGDAPDGGAPEADTLSSAPDAPAVSAPSGR